MEKVLKVSVMLAAIDKMSAVIEKASASGIKSLTRLNKEADRISQSAFDLGTSAGAFGLALGAPLYAAVQAASDVETMQIALKTAFQGNEQAANKAYETINKFAAKTPYELNEVMTGFIKLKNMGLDPSTEALTAYGNTASAMGKSLNDMVEAVADAATGEFERLKEFGIRASSEGDKVKFTFQGVTTTVKKDAGQIELYLKNLGLTKFAGGIEAQSKSFKGQMSTMMDSIKMFAANLGKVLIPVITDLFKKLSPVLEQIQSWMEKNPKLTKYIVYGTAALSAFMLATSGVAFAVGGIAKTVSMLSGAFTFLMANPIVLWITAFAGLAFLVYRNWEPIANFFKRIWAGVVAVFGPVINTLKFIIWNFTPIGWIARLWTPISGLFKAIWSLVTSVFDVAIGAIKFVLMNFTPIGLIYKHWTPISNFFKNIWEKVKAPFVSAFNWVTNFGKRFFQAGANIIQSIIDGITSKVTAITDKIKGVAKKIRDFFPFSPAKAGPLMDIHRVKLVETIADNVKPAPVMKAMTAVTEKVRSAIPKQTGLAGSGAVMGGLGAIGGGMRGLTPAGAGAGGGMVVNFSPTINMAGGSAQERQDFLSMLKQYEPDLLRVIRDAMERNDRKKFS